MSKPKPETAESADVEPKGSEDAPSAEAAAAGEVQDPLAQLQREADELREKNLRLLAEVQNLHKRAAREKQEALRYAEGDFARELLPVLDDFERTRVAAEQSEDLSAVVDGVRIVHEHFLKVLAQRGIAPIESLHEPFDPSLHEAMLQQPSDEHPAGIVIQELARGYKMHDRVLRHSRVIVSSGPAPAVDDNAAGSDTEDQ